MERVLQSGKHPLRQHVAEQEGRDGLFAAVDQTRPTLARQTKGLLQEHRDFVEQLGALREQARRVTHSLLPIAVDCSALGQRVLHFLDVLHQHSRKETGLVLESMETDIGVCD